MAKPPKLSQEALNRLTRRETPLIAELQGPGPFQLPLLTTVDSLLARGTGHLELRLETELAQEVRIVLTEEVGAAVHRLLGAEFARQAEGAKGKKN